MTDGFEPLHMFYERGEINLINGDNDLTNTQLSKGGINVGFYLACLIMKRPLKIIF